MVAQVEVETIRRQRVALVIIHSEAHLKEMMEEQVLLHLRTEVEVVAAVRVGLDQQELAPLVETVGQELLTIFLAHHFFMLVGAEVEHTMEVLLVQEAQVSEGVGALQLTQIIPAQTEQMVVEAAAEAAQFLLLDNQTAATAATA